MEPKYILTNESEEFYTEENCHIIELLNAASSQAFSVARARIKPGETTKWHALKGTIECYYILSGTGLAEINKDFKQKMVPHSLLKIPVESPQRITNLGKEDLIILCICSPAFETKNYRKLED